MKRIFLAAIVLLLATAAYSRDVIDIRKWDFRLDAEKTWRSVTIPHDFQMELPWEEEAGGARGFKRMETGWYRTTFVAGKDWEGECVLLDFEGVGMQADIWVNGQQAGEIDYGYIGGCFDIRALLKYGAENEILVKTFTGKAESSRWYTGGGLFRPVHLI
ncbi:MAG: beta-galactosidase, partial [Bacteroidales bacterium]|nr:beta-galactosidase [Bacteroidales bacterium]